MPHDTPTGHDDHAADVSIKPPDVVAFRGVFGFAETIDRVEEEIAGRVAGLCSYRSRRQCGDGQPRR
jgi:hypothetical protein